MEKGCKMGEEIQMIGTAKDLCDFFGLLNDVKNERQLLNIIYLAQKRDLINEIYNDFIVSDLGPFSERIFFDLELLKDKGVIIETGVPGNTIFLTDKGKQYCSFDKQVPNTDFIKSLKKLNISELVDINKYLYLVESGVIKKGEFQKLNYYLTLKEERFNVLKSNIKKLFISD